MNQGLNDPAAGVPQQLLPHLHLVSKHRYPITSNPSLEGIVGYLSEAPRIVRDAQPMQWQMIDTPPDGTLLLSWQPLDYLGTNFASDGFVWADTEHIFKSEVRGYSLEMFLQRSGYRAQGEAMASHCRRRYRLLPGNPALGLPTPDPSLWITHYSKASSRDHVPAASIPIPPHIHAQIQQRRMIQSQGQLPRKEFMLHDRSNWPTIHLPPAMATPGPPGPAAGHRRAGSFAMDTSVEEDEDVSRGDIFDFMTSRDVSRVRYEQHHDWMEEIVESPYPTLSIIPSDLGLGRSGALEELSKDFFDAPTPATRDGGTGSVAPAGKVSPGDAEQFVKRASSKLADMQSELDRLRKTHGRRMGKLAQATALNLAEKKLRTAPHATERRRSSTTRSDSGADAQNAVDVITHSFESETGRTVSTRTLVTVVSKGGLDERQAKPPPMPARTALKPSEASTRTAPTTLKPSEASMRTESSLERPAPAGDDKTTDKEGSGESSEVSTGVNTDAEIASAETPVRKESDAAGDAALPPPPTEAEDDGLDLPSLKDIGMDVNMDGLDDESGDQGGQNGSEWVMIDEKAGQASEQVEPQPAAEKEARPPVEKAKDATDATGPEATDTAAKEAVQETQAHPTHDSGLDTPNFDMGGDFDNVEVDTAGDALARYGDDDDLELDPLEDSAFGDAFHPEEDEEIS